MSASVGWFRWQLWVSGSSLRANPVLGWKRSCGRIGLLPLTRSRRASLSIPEPSLSTVQTDTSEEIRPDSEPELSEWMRAAQAGETEPYRLLLKAIEPRMRAMVRSRISDGAAAEDVIQNALLSIHRGRATYRPERPFIPWMRAIVRNSIIDYFRERKRRSERETILPVEQWPDRSDEHRPQDEALAPELQAAIAALPEKQREAVTLVQVDGLSVAEAALRAGISPGALKVRAHRGYRALRDALKDAREEGVWRSAKPGARTMDSQEGGPT